LLAWIAKSRLKQGKNSLEIARLGNLTAMAFVLFAMIFVFTLLQWKYARGDVEY